MGFGKKRSNKVGVGAITTNKKKLFAEGGMMDDGKDVDPVSGNDVPTGSLAEEVRDDVDAKLSPGEFVFPADVVRFIGLERLMQMRDQAKKGLMRMNDIGQMGNAEEAGEKADDTYEEDDDFESDIDEIMKEVDQEETGRQTEQAFNTGGFVNQSYYDIAKAPKNPALDIRYFKDSEGKDFYMPFINGKPMKPMPNGAVQSIAPPPKPPKSTGDKVGGGGPGAGAGALVPSPLGGIVDINKPVDTTGPATQQQQIEDAKNAGASSGIAGVYTGENLADFGRADMIYNPGGSGPAGEIMGEDLWNSSISSADVKLGTAVLSALAAAMGVPGIATLPFRLAVNKFGADKAMAWLGAVNREKMGRASGVDTSTPEGMASAASQIDQVIYKNDVRANAPAATAGAIGTGSIAAQASSAVSDALRGTGLSDDDIGNLSQRAADSVVRGIDMNTAVNNAKNAAVDAIQEKFSDEFGLANVTREDIVNTVFNNVRGTEELTGSWMETPDLSANLPNAVVDKTVEFDNTMTNSPSETKEGGGEVEKIEGFDPSLFELRVPGMEDYYRNLDESQSLSGTMGGRLGEDDFGSFNDVATTPEPFEFTPDDALFGDFWGTMDNEEVSSEDEEGLGFGSFMGLSSPNIDSSFFRKQETEER